MSRSVQDLATVILAGGPGERLSTLTERRAIPAVPFAGKYRIIDFTLSNCVNSGLYNILVLTQYRHLSLHEHIGNGKPWDLDRLHGGVRVLPPYLGRSKGLGWDRGTADAVYQNLSELVDMSCEDVLILAGDHVYKLDYRLMMNLHLETDADVTVGIIRTPIEQAHRFGIVTVDDSGRVLDFKEKPPEPEDNLVSMGIYIFKKEVLIERLTQDAANPESRHDFGHNILPEMIRDGLKVYAYLHDGYWQDVGTAQAYWSAHMELLATPPVMDLYERDWVIYTRSEEQPPARLGPRAKLERSMVSHGCQILGTVIHSVLSPGVVVEEGAIVRDSVIMTNTVVGKNAVVDRAVIDKEVVIGADSYIGYGEDNTPNRLEPQRLNTGITLIAKRVKLPDGLKVGRNCRIGSDVRPEHFTSLELVSGESVVLPES